MPVEKKQQSTVGRENIGDMCKRVLFTYDFMYVFF